MSELTVKFNSIDLSKLFRVIDIDRADQNEIVLTVKMRTSDSRSMQQNKRELRKILMTDSSGSSLVMSLSYSIMQKLLVHLMSLMGFLGFKRLRLNLKHLMAMLIAQVMSIYQMTR